METASGESGDSDPIFERFKRCQLFYARHVVQQCVIYPVLLDWIIFQDTPHRVAYYSYQCQDGNFYVLGVIHHTVIANLLERLRDRVIDVPACYVWTNFSDQALEQLYGAFRQLGGFLRIQDYVVRPPGPPSIRHMSRIVTPDEPHPDQTILPERGAFERSDTVMLTAEHVIRDVFGGHPQRLMFCRGTDRTPIRLLCFPESRITKEWLDLNGTGVILRDPEIHWTPVKETDGAEQAAITKRLTCYDSSPTPQAIGFTTTGVPSTSERSATQVSPQKRPRLGNSSSGTTAPLPPAAPGINARSTDDSLLATSRQDSINYSQVGHWPPAELQPLIPDGEIFDDAPDAPAAPVPVDAAEYLIAIGDDFSPLARWLGRARTARRFIRDHAASLRFARSSPAAPGETSNGSFAGSALVLSQHHHPRTPQAERGSVPSSRPLGDTSDPNPSIQLGIEITLLPTFTDPWDAAGMLRTLTGLARPYSYIEVNAHSGGAPMQRVLLFSSGTDGRVAGGIVGRTCKTRILSESQLRQVMVSHGQRIVRRNAFGGDVRQIASEANRGQAHVRDAAPESNADIATCLSFSSVTTVVGPTSRTLPVPPSHDDVHDSSLAPLEHEEDHPEPGTSCEVRSNDILKSLDGLEELLCETIASTSKELFLGVIATGEPKPILDAIRAYIDRVEDARDRYVKVVGSSQSGGGT